MMKNKIVIKLGGSSLVNSETLGELSKLVKGYQTKGFSVVLVHGGGPAINLELARRGIDWKFIDGQRQTTLEMMSIIEKVLAGQVNSMVVESLQKAQITAQGLSGADQVLFCKAANKELMQVGVIEKVAVTAIDQILETGKVPVIAPIGVGVSGEKFNINADWAATEIAIALGAKKLIFLTDQKGILNEEKNIVARATPTIIEQMIAKGVISGGMCTKVRAMASAISAGVGSVRVLHASHASQLLGEKNVGTLLTLRSTAKPTLKRDFMHGRAS